MQALKASGTPRSAVRAALCALAVCSSAALATRDAHAQTCNPNQLTSTTTARPDSASDAGTIVYMNLMTNCPFHKKQCGGRFAVTNTTTEAQKCALIRDTIIANCSANPGPNFQIATDQCAGSSTFTVVDPDCTAGPDAGGGLLLGLSNAMNTFSQEDAGGLPDYEADLLRQGCATASTCLLTLGGVATGVATNPPTANVVLYVDLTAMGGTLVSVGEDTTPGERASVIMTNLINNISQELALATCTKQPGGVCGVSCAQTPGFPRAASCIQAAGTNAIAVALQLNDTGISRIGTCGPDTINTSLMGQVNNPDAAPFDHVDVVGCSTVTSLTATPSSAPPGGTIALSVAAVDNTGRSTSSFAWTVLSGSGSLTNASTATPTFTCGSGGAVTLDVAALGQGADGGVCAPSHQTTTVNCTPVIMGTPSMNRSGWIGLAMLLGVSGLVVLRVRRRAII